MIIKTIDSKTGQAQHWAVELCNINLQHLKYLVEFYGEVPSLYKVEKEIEQINSCYARDMKAIPLQGDTYSQVRTEIRGYENDTDPWIVRGKRVPLVRANIWKNHTTNNYEVAWHSDEYNGILLDSAKKDLAKRFDEQLLEHLLNPAVLKTVKHDAIQYILSYAAEGIAGIRKQLDTIEDYVKTQKGLNK